MMWGTPQKKAEATLKQGWPQASALRLPDPEKAFQLYVHEREGIAVGVLTQRLGSQPQPVAYLSKRLSPTAQGWPHCLQNLATIAILIEDALKLSFGCKLIFYQPPSEKPPKWEKPLWMSDQRILRYQVVLMENSGLTTSPCEILTYPPSCLPLRAFSPFTLALDHWAKPREGLLEDPLTNPEEIWYTDGSSFIFHGNRI